MGTDLIKIGWSSKCIRWLSLAFVLLVSTVSGLAQDVVQGRVANPHGNLRIACENCHTTTAWRPIRQQPEFDHNTQTKFPLRGLHTDVSCRSCHVGLVFASTGTRCSDCHADLHRRQFGSNCEDCHTVRGWKVTVSAVQQHNNRFPLLGAHAAAECEQCHRNAASGVFVGLSTQCVSCHLNDYQKAASVNHRAANFPTACETCHGMDRWQGARFDHLQFAHFSLTGAHAQVACNSCHVGGRFQGTPTDCFSCHVNDFTAAQAPNHVTSAFPHDCTVCHTTATWQGASFDHNTLTPFALTGAHTSVQCAQCHVAGRFAGTPMDCAGCHLTDYQKTTNPNHAKSAFPTDCETCHTTATWQGAKFDHTLSKFPLTGAHMTVACEQCHVNNVFTGTTQQCSGCHLTDFQKATNPNHVSAGFPQDCTLCHTTSAWQGAKFDHNTATKFLLTGAHTSVQCAQCHVNNVFAGTASQCVGCHLTDFQKTTAPNHATSGFSQDCASCHTTAKWQGATFDHSTTGFALAGAHATVQCAQCHVSGRFAGTPQQCSGCHMSDFQSASNPNHTAAGFPQDCAVCHNTVQWIGAKFDHSTATKFPLTGAHASVLCAQCHTTPAFASTPMDCAGCHLADFKKAVNPNHTAAGFPTDCAQCHQTVQWQGATFNHATTGFALTGSHTTVQCAQCHVNNNYAIKGSACVTCHLTDYNGTINPNHATAGFPTDCSTCHNTTQWKGATFNHSTTGFTLTGAHVNVFCVQCHVNNNYSLSTANTACVSCHLGDFNNAAAPNHRTGGFSQDCTTCHNTTQWTGAAFNHATTGFALTGAHTTTQCAQCHVNNNYTLKDTACATCHLTDYNTAVNPNHKSAGFPTDCTGCHNTIQWKGAVFNHSTTGFTLTGAHTTAQCAQCHVNNNYTLTTANTACASCHLSDFNSAADPNHKAAGFPTDCTACHNTIQWKGATFNHTTTGFALTGAHTTVQCAQCHVNSNYSITTAACASCHLSDFNSAADPNHKAAGFPTDCTACHNTTQWKGATFNHTTTGFALTGAHTTVQCAQCHVNSNYSITTAACASCHLTDYNATVNPNHKTAGFPTDCTGCHNTTQWKGATFNHTTTGFALTGAHNTAQCAQCHVNGNYTLSAANTACASCHLTDYNATVNPNHKTAGFPTDCTGCHNTTQWKGATFNHTTTGFALTGAHNTAQCAQCHVNGNYTLSAANTACASCHLTDYNATVNPNHKTAGFPTDCTGCHNTTQWKGATFNHTTTGFPLTGAHAAVQCAQCHTNNNFALTSANSACSSCHMSDYNKTVNPNHKTAGFPTDCTGCHNTTAFKGATFNHTSTGFALTGAHTTTQCAQCHVNNNYALTSAACATCHLADYNGTTNPNHKAAAFPQDCTLCHNTTAFKGATFNHTTTGFTLTGAHTSAQCAQCHVNGNYSLTTANTACASCHLTDYNATTNPAHKSAGFPTDCTGCHNTTQWKGATFNHTTTGFALTGAHTSAQCAQCHVNGNYNLTTSNTACASCHLTDYNNTTNPNHKAAGFPQDCTGCHNTTQWKGATFNHTTTGFALTGAHVKAQCTQCHVNGNYNLTTSNTACASCHLTDYNNTTNPNHKAAAFPQDCTLCHNTTAFKGATFNHTTTGFTLTGAHTSAQCAQCHVNGNYSLTTANTACASCHLTDYNNTTNPNHKAAAFPQDCTLCHNTTAFKGATFNHTTTGFTLTGAHTSAQCAQCHVNGNYSLTTANTACASCHLTDYNNTTNPAHKSAGFPTDCTGCHNTTQWKGATFNHTTTGFTLTGAHTSAQCAQCHVNGNYSLTTANTACASCHLTDYNNTTNPNHKAAAFPQDCTLCHNTTAFKGATFNHTTTGFALTGAHTSAQCAQCHVNGNYSLTAANTACASCHLTDYNATTNPAHKSAGFPTDCTGCHNTTQWKGATFNHTTTGFALTGAHASAQCAQCHVNGNYSLTTANTACASCHLTDYNNTTNPNHKAAAFPQDCTLCHNTTAFKGATFNHTTTGFALTGAHTSAQCAQCHVNGNYSLTAANTACASCHLTDYNATTNPAHKSAGFPTDCTICHNTTAFKPSTFNHNTSTTFPLTGAHTSVACATCHVNNVYKGLATTCVSCHLTDYNNTTNPNHKAAAFPQDCTLCHNTTAFKGATFNHATTGFTLTGAHTSLQCAQCHVNSNYSLTSANTACASCHLTDYNNTTNPSHKTAGFPTDCSGCHTTTSFAGATFNHAATGFTLTGAHTSAQCAQCHVNGNYTLNTASTACANCHLTDYNNTTNPNHKSAGFPTDCSICHSTTNFTSATFNHATTAFPLTGAHTSVACASCHVNSVFKGTPKDCYSCHKADYTGVTDPNHVAAGFPTTCDTCHTTTSFSGATFNHTWFPIYSGTHKGKWTTCADCHTNPANYTVFSCIVCHQHSNQTSVTKTHSGVKNFVYNGTSCYSCHPTGKGG